MLHPVYEKLKDLARSVSQGLPQPAFLRDHAGALRRAEETLATDDLIRRCRSFLDESRLECAHGVCHCESVARDAGALVLVEAGGLGIGAQETGRLALAAEIAGLLHDIKRREDDHAVRGSIEAGNILAGLGVEGTFNRYVTGAIRNHEAFKAAVDAVDAPGRLVSDALYDADKFRWGPENFTATLWIMVEARNTPPEALHRKFHESMQGIGKIRETFRTAAGKKYGPEFIDQGLVIGQAIYRELTAALDIGP